MVIAMQISNALFKSLDRSCRKTSPVLELGVRSCIITYYIQLNTLQLVIANYFLFDNIHIHYILL